MEEKKVYIIQEEFQGIPGGPMVFSREEDADRKLIDLVNENIKAGNIGFDDETSFTHDDFEKAFDFIRDADWVRWGIRYFVCVIDEDSGEK